MRRLAVSMVLLCVTVVFAQQRSRGGRRGAPPAPSAASEEEITWEVNPNFQKDLFTFVRIKYESKYDGGWRGEKWGTDWPDSDKNFSFRLQQMTALKVNPEPVIIELTDQTLYEYPWIYFVEPGALVFTDEEVEILRRYLLHGGFAMFDDFWGVAEYENLHEQLKRVFPEKEPEDVPMTHPVFNCVFPLNEKLHGVPPQIPNITLGMQSEFTGVTWERPDALQGEYKALYDDKGRMMVIICHNTDNGDGWEQEGVSEYYFREFSEKKAYPLGINIIFYAMTH